MMNYDLVVIGAGTAGLVSSFVASSLGAKVLLVERGRMGGECLWTGCVPSKTLIKSARVFDTIARSEEFGIHVEKPRVIWSAIKLRIADVRDDIRKLEREEMQKSGVEFLTGEASFVDKSTLQIMTKDGAQTISAKKFILAAGTRARVPQIPGLDETPFMTHEQIFDLPALPRSMVIIGGGPIGCEFAQAFARLGTRVTLLQKSKVLLTKEDEEISATATKLLRSSGVTLHLEADVLKTQPEENGAMVTFEAAGETQTVRASQLLVATGKEPDLAALNLEAAGVQTNESGVVVDEKLQTSASHIWACGDITGKYLFTHVAEYQGKIAAQNALLPVSQKADYRVVPWTTFTDPEISHLGLTQAEAQAEHGDIKVYRQPFKTLDRAIIEGETQGFLKLITTGSGRIIGAHMIGPGAGELIHQFVPAVRDGALIHEFAEAIHVYPTLSEIAHRAGNEAYREMLDNKTVKWALDKFVR
jgi:pyruvate/2-oxoglutarate dehydrogenase complex dihydrolipoamide dehydrogenase (E3) component